MQRILSRRYSAGLVGPFLVVACSFSFLLFLHGPKNSSSWIYSVGNWPAWLSWPARSLINNDGRIASAAGLWSCAFRGKVSSRLLDNSISSLPSSSGWLACALNPSKLEWPVFMYLSVRLIYQSCFSFLFVRHPSDPMSRIELNPECLILIHLV